MIWCDEESDQNHVIQVVCYAKVLNKLVTFYTSLWPISSLSLPSVETAPDHGFWPVFFNAKKNMQDFIFQVSVENSNFWVKIMF